VEGDRMLEILVGNDSFTILFLYEGGPIFIREWSNFLLHLVFCIKGRLKSFFGFKGGYFER
jgi:hypothetical protein